MTPLDMYMADRGYDFRLRPFFLGGIFICMKELITTETRSRSILYFRIWAYDLSRYVHNR